MNSLTIEGVRCFSALQQVELRPLTILVGDNSSGKSTFLALVRIAWDIAQGQRQIDFNEEPFQLGAYDQIAHWRGGRPDGAKSFTVGASFETRQAVRRPGAPSHLAVTATFQKRGVEPRLSRWVLESTELRCEVKLPADDGGRPKLAFISGVGAGADPMRLKLMAPPPVGSGIPEILRLGLWPTVVPMPGSEPERLPDRRLRESLDKTLQLAHWGIGTRPLAFSPIRTQPRRTYDPLKEIPRPEGSHVPVTMARLSAAEPGQWKELEASMSSFGRASGLFSSVEIRRVGRKESDPFQVQVNVSGQAFNLVDVGYGVSQVLPIIVDVLRGPVRSTFLLQQPEVHLHPRAQAALGSFLASLVSLQKKRLVVETHSDYLVDRVRMDVRDGRVLKPEQVLILYFERHPGHVEIQPIELDEHGNLREVPEGYRSFFLEEDRRLLGIA